MSNHAIVSHGEEVKSPYVYFGGKSRIAPLVWERLGDPGNFVEPFFGSGAVTLARPHWPFIGSRTETINDADGMVANFWRALKADPEATAEWADQPVFENDLHARHIWLRERVPGLCERLEGDPDYYDAKIAGWWVWGMACWIGGGWCGEAGMGPWGVQIIEEDGEEFRVLRRSEKGQGVIRRLPHLGDAGQGVKRQLPHLGDAGRGITKESLNLISDLFTELSERMRRVRVCCGGWERVCGPSVTVKHGLTGVFLDPPYDLEMRDAGCYTVDRPGIAAEVLAWCVENGPNPLLRIALCGYEGEHNVLSEKHGWDCVSWKGRGGFGSQGKNTDAGKENAKKERIWFSPACLKPTQSRLMFD